MYNRSKRVLARPAARPPHAAPPSTGHRGVVETCKRPRHDDRSSFRAPQVSPKLARSFGDRRTQLCVFPPTHPFSRPSLALSSLDPGSHGSPEPEGRGGLVSSANRMLSCGAIPHSRARMSAVAMGRALVPDEPLEETLE